MKKLISVLLVVCLFWINSAHALRLFGGLVHIDDDLLEAPQTKNKTPWEKKSGQMKNLVARETKGTASFRSNRNVDIVAGRIKREFGFKTREEMVTTRKGKYAVNHFSFRDDVQPGIYYHMGGVVHHLYSGRDNREIIQVLVERDGSGSRVDFTFHGVIGDEREYGRSLVARAKRAIRR